MKKILLLSSVAALFAMVASAGSVTFSTAGSLLSCNGVSGCVQNSSTQVTIGGNIVVSYNAIPVASPTTVNAPTNINLGTLVTSCFGGSACSSTDVSGLLLTLTILSTPPSASGSVPGNTTGTGSFQGLVTVQSSLAQVSFGAANTTSAAGNYPGVIITGGGLGAIYQVTNSPLSLVPPSSGTAPGTTTIQGFVQVVPEPSTVLLMSAGLGLVLFGRRRFAK